MLRAGNQLAERAFAPVDYSPKAPSTNGAGLRLQGSILFSASGRPIDSKAGLEIDPAARLAEKLGAFRNSWRKDANEPGQSIGRGTYLGYESLIMPLFIPSPCLDPRA